MEHVYFYIHSIVMDYFVIKYLMQCMYMIIKNKLRILNKINLTAQ